MKTVVILSERLDNSAHQTLTPRGSSFWGGGAWSY